MDKCMWTAKKILQKKKKNIQNFLFPKQNSLYSSGFRLSMLEPACRELYLLSENSRIRERKQ